MDALEETRSAWVRKFYLFRPQASLAISMESAFWMEHFSMEYIFPEFDSQQVLPGT